MKTNRPERQYRKLSRTELIELLIEESEKNERLQAQLDAAREALSSRELRVENAGSIAEAALAVNRVFEAAEAP